MRKHQEDIVHAILAERLRQELLHPGRTCAHGKSHQRKLVIVAEEFGEVARAIHDGDHENLKAELVQLAATCFAWLESLGAPEEQATPLVENTPLGAVKFRANYYMLEEDEENPKP